MEGKGQGMAVVVKPDDGVSVIRKPDLVTTKTDNHSDLTYPLNYHYSKCMQGQK